MRRWGRGVAAGGRAARVATGLLLALVLVGSVVALAPGRARAWRVFLTSRGAEVHWENDAPPFVLQPGWPLAGGDAMVTAAMAAALAPWVATPCGVPPLTFGGLDPEAQLDDADGRGSVVWIDSASSWNARFGATELARTLVAFRVGSGAILDTDVAVNLGGHAFAVSDACPDTRDRYDLTSVLTHELGHALGLDHSDIAEATMFPKTEEGHCELRTLAEDDLAGLCHLYPVLSGVDRGPEPGPEVPPEPGAAEPGSASDAAGEAVEGDAPGTDRDTPAEAVERPHIETSLGCGGASSAASGLLVLGVALLARRLARQGRGSRARGTREA